MNRQPASADLGSLKTTNLTGQVERRDTAAIPRRLLALEKEIEVTRSLAVSLHERLTPVLGPHVPTDNEHAGEKDAAEGSPVAEEIYSITGRLGQVQDVLRDALDRLEVSQ